MKFWVPQNYIIEQWWRNPSIGEVGRGKKKDQNIKSIFVNVGSHPGLRETLTNIDKRGAGVECGGEKQPCVPEVVVGKCSL